MTSRSDEDLVARRRRLVRDSQDGTEWRRGVIGGSPEEDAPPRSRGTPGHSDDWFDRPWSSRALHRLGEVSAHAGAGLAVSGAILAWLAVGVVTGFPGWWETVLYSTGSSVTLVMVFAIQHTQTRQQSATHRKLDELLRAQPRADNTLIAVEEAPDQELEARATLNLRDRQAEPTEEGPAGLSPS